MAEQLFATLNTNRGAIRIELYPNHAPKTVANFVELAEGSREWKHPGTGETSTNKLYDGTTFHRVIAGFMVQGGGFTKDFVQKPTKAPVVNEAEQSSKAGLLNVPGTIAMARTSDPNSASSQFFINVNDNKSLNFRSPDPAGIGYTVFGKVVSGMDVVNKVAKAPTGAGNPATETVMPTVRATAPVSSVGISVASVSLKSIGSSW